MKSRLLKPILILQAVVLLCSVHTHAQVFYMTPGGHFVVNGSPTFVANSAGIKNNGTYAGGNGTLVFTGYADTTISNIIGDSITSTPYLNINKSGLGVATRGRTWVTNVLTMQKGSLYGDSGLTLISDTNNTARVAAVPSNCSILGKVIVQRFIPEKRAWRMLTAPVTSSNSIYDAWQNSGVYTPGVGTMITKPSPVAGDGMDAGINTNYSMKGFNATTQSLYNVTNTKVAISSGTNGNADNSGYFIFVRGDRNPATVGNPSVTPIMNTTLSSAGTLQTGTQVFTCASLALKYTLIGNPYASPIDLNALTLNNVIKRYIMWDPSLNQVGGYVVLDDILNTGTFTKSVQSSKLNNQVQSGQAFFVQTQMNASASVTVTEASKSSGVNLYGFRPANTGLASLTATLYLLNTDNSVKVADGTLAQFRDDFDTAVNWQDARKLGNVNESFGLLRDGAFLAIERRPTITANDTLFFKLTATSARSYEFAFAPDNLYQDGLSAFLIDNYLGTSTPVSLTDTTKIDFSVVSGVAASSASDRFKIIFNESTLGTLPVTFTTVKASQKNTDVAVEWDVDNELNMIQYEVERSADGKTFTQTDITIATGNKNSSIAYSWIDTKPLTGANYYRIKSVDRNGTVKYSQIVRVVTGKAESDISTYPNPVTDNVMTLQFSNEPQGDYIVNLLSSNGQLIYTKQMHVNSNNTSETIKLRPSTAKGTYELKIEGPAKTTQKVIIQ